MVWYWVSFPPFSKKGWGGLGCLVGYDWTEGWLFCVIFQIFLSLRDERRVVADQIMEARKAEEDSLWEDWDLHCMGGVLGSVALGRIFNDESLAGRSIASWWCSGSLFIRTMGMSDLNHVQPIPRVKRSQQVVASKSFCSNIECFIMCRSLFDNHAQTPR